MRSGLFVCVDNKVQSPVTCLFVCVDNKVQSPVTRSPTSQLPKQPVPSPTRTAESGTPVSRASAASKGKEEEVDEESESGESETESEESSLEEEDSTPFVEYDAEPLAKSRTQSRSTIRSVVNDGDVQRPPGKAFPKSPSPEKPKSPVATVPDRNPAASISPVGRVSQSSFGFPAVNTEPGFAGKSPRSSVTVVPVQSPGSPVSPVGRSPQPSPVVNAESAYAGKSQASPAVHSPVPSNEPDYAGKSQRSPTVRLPVAYSEPGDALKFQRSPDVHSPAATIIEPAYSGKSQRSQNYASMLEPEFEYAQFDSEPMSRNRQHIPYVDDDDELPPAPLPGSPRKPSSPPVRTSTLVPPPSSPLMLSQASFVQTFEAPPVMAPRATEGPILMPPPPVSQPKPSPVLRPTGFTSQDNHQTSEVPAGRFRPPSVSRMSPHPPAPHAETGGDAVSQLFMKLETNYTNPPSQMPPVQSQEPSYGPGYRPSAHGAVVRQQEPYPVEVTGFNLLLLEKMLNRFLLLYWQFKKKIQFCVNDAFSMLNSKELSSCKNSCFFTTIYVLNFVLAVINGLCKKIIICTVTVKLLCPSHRKICKMNGKNLSLPRTQAVLTC